MDSLRHMSPADLRQLGLVELLDRVCNYADKRALDDFHERRRPFRWNGERHLRFIELVDRLRENALRGLSRFRSGDTEAVDRTCEILVDRFLSLPPEGAEQQDSRPSRNRTVDCRRHIRPYVRAYNRIVGREPHLGLLDRERLACRLLQRHVLEHFRRALAEGRRSAFRFCSRYEWKTDGGSLYLWFREDIAGAQRRAFLEANVEDVDPRRPGERQLVQSIIDSRIGRPRQVKIADCDEAGAPASASPHDLAVLVHRGIAAEGLASVVASEKVENIAQQRPAIQALGPVRLRELVLYIFERLDLGEYHDGEIAARFSLSAASFSRFAGSRWLGRLGQNSRTDLPDLWVNCARVLAADPRLAEVAEAAGVLQEVREIATGGFPPNSALGAPSRVSRGILPLFAVHG